MQWEIIKVKDWDAAKELSGQGWELVTTTLEAETKTHTYILKRQIISSHAPNKQLLLEGQ